MIVLPNSSLKIYRLDGDLTPKKRREALSEIQASVHAKQPILIMVTGSLIGEGFDLPGLDFLTLASPLSFEGQMIQYAGRIHRASEGKTVVQIIDFIDSFSGIFMKMYRNRLKAYKKMGYTVANQGSLL